MAKLQLTDAQRDAIDAQIRDRILDELTRTRGGRGEAPVSAVVEARCSFGFDADSKHACPYYRTCHLKGSECLNYRGCISYGVNVADDIAEGKVDLRAIGIDLSELSSASAG